MKYLLVTLPCLWVLNLFGQADTIPGRAIHTNGFSSYIDTRFNQHLPKFTVECWAKSPQVPNGRQGKGPVHYEENFQVNWDHVSSGARHSLVLRDSAGGWHAASFGDQWEPDTWYHLAGTYDGVMMKAYRNGKLISTNANPVGPPRQEPASLKIGKHARLSSPQHEFHEGTTDEVRIWNRALNESEIRENMHKTLNGTEQGLVLYYQFNEWPLNPGMDSTLEKVSGRYSALLVQNPERRASTAPVGKAESASSAIEALPQNYLALYDMRFTTTTVAQTGNLTATSMKTSIVGDTFSGFAGKVEQSRYWIVNFDDRLVCEGKTNLLMPESLYMALENYRPNPMWMFHRPSNSDKAWLPVKTTSQELPMGAPFVMLEFDTLLEGQFIVGRIDTGQIVTHKAQSFNSQETRIWAINGRLFIHLEADHQKQATLELISLQGKVLVKTRLKENENQSLHVIPSISSGLYLWRINHQQGQTTGRVFFE